MLFITGLLTLLAIAQAGGDHVKGGSRIKGGSITQEQVAQHDIIPSPFNVKTEPTFGTKLTRQEVIDPSSGIKTLAASKTAQSPSLHHAVKTAADLSGKSHRTPSLHHAAAPIVAQYQVPGDDPAPSSNLKTLKTSAATGKTSFSQKDAQERDPIAHPVVQTIKTVENPTLPSTKTLKTISTRKTVLRDPVATPVIQTVKNIPDPATSEIKTLKTVSTSKTRFSQGDTQSRDPIERPAIQTRKAVQDPSVFRKTIKTISKPATLSSPRTKTAGKTSQQVIDSQKSSSIPESIVIAARRNSLESSIIGDSSSSVSRIRTSSENQNADLLSGTRSQIQAGSGLANAQGGMTLDEETLTILQNAGGIVTENGEIAVNDIGLKIIESLRAGSTLQSSSGSLSIDGERGRISTRRLSSQRRPDITSTNLLRTGETDRSQRVSNANQRVTTVNRATVSSVNSRSGTSSLQSGIIRGGSATGSPTVGSTQGGMTLDEETLKMLQTSGGIDTLNGELTVNEIGLQILQSMRGGSPIQRINPGSRATVSSVSSRSGTSPLQSGIIREGSETGSTTVDNTQGGMTLDEETLKILQTSGGIETLNGELTVNEIGFQILQSIRGSSPIQRMTTGSRTVSSVSSTSGTSSLQSGIIRGYSTTGSSTVGSTQGGMTLDEETLKMLQTSGGIDTLNGELTVNEIGLQILQSIRGGSPIQGITPGNRATVSSVSSRSGTSSLQSGIIRGGYATGSTTLGSTQGGMTLDEETLKMLQTSGGIDTSNGELNVNAIGLEMLQRLRAGSSLQSQGALNTGVEQGLVSARRPSSSAANSATLNTARGAVTSGIRPETIRRTVGTQGIRRVQDSGVSSGTRLRIPDTRIGASAGITGQNTAARAETVLFNGKEITIGGVREGQIFDENLQPISGGNLGGQFRKPASISITQAAKPVGPRQQVISSQGTRGSLNLRNQGVYAPKSIKPDTQTIVRSRSQVDSGRQIVATRAETVLFNGKEINIGGAKEGQIFDENLQPISSGISGVTGGYTVNLRAPAASPVDQNIFGTVRTINLHNQGISPISQAPKSALRTTPQIIKPATQTIVRSQSQADIGRQTVATRTDKVLFNGKEISIGGAKEGQLFDENLQPISPGISGVAGGPSAVIKLRAPVASPVSQTAFGARRTVNLRTQGASPVSQAPKPALRRTVKNIKPATQTIVRSQSQADIGRQIVATRTDKVLFNGKEISIGGAKEGQLFDENLQPISPGISGVAGGPSAAINLRAPVASPVSQSAFGARGTTNLLSQGISLNAQAPNSALRRTPQIIKPATQTIVRSQSQGGTGRQTVDTRTDKVLFNGKEISIGGAREGQLFDENLEPISLGISAGGPIAEINLRAPVASPVSQSALRARQTVNLRTQGASTVFQSPKPALRRTTQNIKPATQTIVQSHPQADIGRQNVATRTDKVLFNGKEISIGGAREGQLFDENFQPISPGISRAAGGPSAVINLREPVASPVSQSAFGTRGAINLHSQEISPISQVLNPALRRTPQSIKPATQTIVRSQSQGSTGRQTVATRTDKVLFNGKEISIGGAREGQLFDENLQPISPGISGATGGPSVNLREPAYSPVNQTVFGRYRKIKLRNQGAFAVAQDPKPVLQRIPQYIKPVTQNIVRSRSQTDSGRQTVATKIDKVLFNGKEISIGGAKEGQLFDENLQPISPGIFGAAGGPSAAVNLRAPVASPVSQSSFGTRGTTNLLSQGISLNAQAPNSALRRTPQNIKPVSQTIVRSRTPLANIPKDNVSVRAPISASGIVTGARRQTIRTRTDTVLFNGKEINIGGAKEGQLFDENLRPLSPGISGTLEGPNAAINLRAPAASPVKFSEQSVGGIGGDFNLLSQGIPTIDQAPKLALRQRAPTVSSIRQQTTTTLNSGSVLFNGKEINIDGAREGQLFDENLQPILPGGPLNAIPENIRTAGIQAVKPVSRPSISRNTANLQGVRLGPSGAIAPNYASARRQTPLINISPGVGRTTSGVRSSTSQVVSSNTLRGSGLLSSLGGITGNDLTGAQKIESLTSGIVLFNGKEINIDGVKEGQIFDENLRPILSENPGISRSSSVSSQSTGLRSPSAAGLRSGISSSRTSIQSGLRSQSISRQGSQTGNIGEDGSLPFIDVTRSGGSLTSSSISSISNPVAYSASGRVGSRGKTSPSRISQDQLDTSITKQKQENAFLSTPDAQQQQIQISDPITKTLMQKPLDPTTSRQTQLKIEDVLEQSSLSKPEDFKKNTHLSQINIDTPALQQRLIGGDYSEYLPKTSFLSPFNYALPQLAASKYRDQIPIVQEQQKVEQIFT